MTRSGSEGRTYEKFSAFGLQLFSVRQGPRLAALTPGPQEGSASACTLGLTGDKPVKP